MYKGPRSSFSLHIYSPTRLQGHSRTAVNRPLLQPGRQDSEYLTLGLHCSVDIHKHTTNRYWTQHTQNCIRIYDLWRQCGPAIPPGTGYPL
jgi:hypothetical protein